MLRKLVEADPAALAASNEDGETPLDIARNSNAAPECLGYLSGENWTVMVSDYEDCTIRGCEQYLKEAGRLSEALFEKACNVVQFDRGK